MARIRNSLLGAPLLALIVMAGCTSSSSKADAPASTSTKPVVSTLPALPPPTGPAATFSGPITGGTGTPFLGSATPVTMPKGYTETEYFADGTARLFKATGPNGQDGRWSAEPSGGAAYRTRIVVRRPSNQKDFNGSVLVEWLNVSGGIDAPADYTYMEPEVTRSGYAWVGVSAQKIGVEGGPAIVPVEGAPTGGLKGIDPPRYGSLHHPGDEYALDIYSQIGQALRAPQETNPLAGLRPQRYIAIGESQSAFELTTFFNAIQPITHVYNGFFIHSRGGGSIPLGGGGIATGFAGGIRIRDDQTVPVLIFETETDETFLRYFDARQPDTPYIRMWDVAGAAHADAYLVGGSAVNLGCTDPINSSETHYVVAAGLHAIDQWLRAAKPPAPVARMKIANENNAPAISLDANGNAVGGLRTPGVDVPVAKHSGLPPPSSSVVCSLFGSTVPFDQAKLASLYSGKAEYVAAFTRSLDRTIAAGHILPADRAALLAEAAKVEL